MQPAAGGSKGAGASQTTVSAAALFRTCVLDVQADDARLQGVVNDTLEGRATFLSSLPAPMLAAALANKILCCVSSNRVYLIRQVTRLLLFQVWNQRTCRNPPAAQAALALLREGITIITGAPQKVRAIVGDHLPPDESFGALAQSHSDAFSFKLLSLPRVNSHFLVLQGLAMVKHFCADEDSADVLLAQPQCMQHIVLGLSLAGARYSYYASIFSRLCMDAVVMLLVLRPDEVDSFATPIAAGLLGVLQRSLLQVQRSGVGATDALETLSSVCRTINLLATTEHGLMACLGLSVSAGGRAGAASDATGEGHRHSVDGAHMSSQPAASTSARGPPSLVAEMVTTVLDGIMAWTSELVSAQRSHRA
ncbi:MAG: hypothetical protein EOO65_04560 [Methanosarcinales archaeon]|nr:MAG: hypothetical protein EOO65_04560 [Methanosarcinales archaeon]